ncbi:MAG TPA: glycoside hydrolase family 27 protein [Candidatus Jeotgalibaca merdavium]|uniref:Alpha-galactosidase n=1 Tax=Candidatus Jeotgalibaca merdavium TaxID=2838627 RepID=A0A9D2KWA8_9LACT|nr:glycoside hydrolase family 27 protein [Candidatus Jeotgalibaca merdavium]
MTFLDVAQTPPLGWNSWDCFGASVREEEVREHALIMSQTLKQYGWEYIVVDIQWSEPQADSTVYHPFYPLNMDEYSRLLPAENRFPSAQGGKGFKELGDYIHSLGLKFGIHIMRGIPRQAVHQNTAIKGTDKRARDIALNNICPWNSDMYGVNVDMPEGQLYYNSLFDLYASWGVDFIKVDDIAYSRLYDDAHTKEIKAIRKAIDQTGRQMVLSLSPGPAQLKHGTFLQDHANMWRLTDDFWDSWPSLYQMFDRAAEWQSYVRPGNWPDCDMLPLGHIGIRAVDGGGGDNWTRFTQDEQYLLMTLWTIFQSPLMYGGTLTDIDAFTLGLFTNEEVLHMHRTISGQRQIYRDQNWVIWQAHNEESTYIALFNVSENTQPLEAHLVDAYIGESTYRDLWAKEDINVKGTSIPAHGALLLRR